MHAHSHTHKKKIKSFEPNRVCTNFNRFEIDVSVCIGNAIMWIDLDWNGNDFVWFDLRCLLLLCVCVYAWVYYIFRNLLVSLLTM